MVTAVGAITLECKAFTLEARLTSRLSAQVSKAADYTKKNGTKMEYLKSTRKMDAIDITTGL